MVSDTGELRRDWGQGTYTIETPRSQAAMGWIGGKQIDLADVGIAVRTRNATVAVQSLDQANISESRSILISLGARSVPEPGNRMPFHSEPVVGRLTITLGGIKAVQAIWGVMFNRKSPPPMRTGNTNQPRSKSRYLLVAIEVRSARKLESCR